MDKDQNSKWNQVLDLEENCLYGDKAILYIVTRIYSYCFKKKEKS
jgi:hypothetical protein